MAKKYYDLLFVVFLLIILILTKFSVLNMPYYWDGLNFLAATIDYLQNNGFGPELLSYNLGHPIFFPWFISLMFKIFTSSPIIANLIILISAFLSLFFTYLIGKNLFSRKVGIIASLLLFFTPMFFSYSALLFLDMPLAAFTVMALYFAIRSKAFLYFIFSSLAILTKENGILVVFGVLIAKLIKEKKITKNLIIYSLPILTFLGFLIMNKVYYEEFLYPTTTSLIKTNPIKIIFNFLIILKIIFFDQYRWVLTSLLILSFSNINLKKLKLNKGIILKIVISIFVFLILYKLDILTNIFSSFYPNIGDYLITVKQFSPLFALLFFLILLKYEDIIKEFSFNKNIYIVITFFITLIAFSLIVPISPRYLIPLLPSIFLFYSSSLCKLFKKYSYLVASIIIIIFVFNFTGNRSNVGFALENNMEYIDVIKTHQMAASYIENDFPNANVLAAFPQSSELKYTYGGYVKKSIKVITYSPLPGVVEKNFTQFLYPEAIPEFNPNLSNIDLYYYSPQEYPTKPILETAKKLNLTLIKKFEINNKSTEIYIVNK